MSDVKISIYEFMVMNQNNRGYDVWDKERDVCVTLDNLETEVEENDYYTLFVEELIKKVQFKKQTYDYIIIAEWSEFIIKNMQQFRKFTKEHWQNQYKDEDTFIFQWIKELHGYISGLVPEDFYKTLYDFVETLETAV
jgi:hypothetical protein